MSYDFERELAIEENLEAHDLLDRLDRMEDEDDDPEDDYLEELLAWMEDGGDVKDPPDDDGGDDSQKWRVGRQMAINVYEGDRPICQCHTAIDAKLIVDAVNKFRGTA